MVSDAVITARMPTGRCTPAGEHEAAPAVYGKHIPVCLMLTGVLTGKVETGRMIASGLIEKLRHLPATVFGDRKIIVISDHKVMNIPMGARFQWAGVMFACGFMAWASYATGSYITTQSELVRKDRQISLVATEHQKMEKHFDLLKHDLLKVTNNPVEMDGYKSYILSQYNDSPSAAVQRMFDEAPRITEDASSDTLLQRIAYLETRLSEVHTQKEHMMQAIRQTTRGKIAELETVITTARLKPEDLKKLAPIIPDSEEEANASGLIDSTKAGGPYLPIENMRFASDELTLVAEVEELSLLHDIVEAMPLARPMEGARLTSHFGRRKDPITGRWAFHAGMDFAGKSRDKIFAPADGKVVYAGRRGAYGNFVEIDHGFGITTRYGHLWKIKVQKGNTIEQGALVGLQGNTGRSTGQHLHYEVRFQGRPLNPKYFLKAGQTKDQQDVF